MTNSPNRAGNGLHTEPSQQTPAPGSLFSDVKKLNDEVAALGTSARDAASDIEKVLTDSVAKHPYATVLAAATIGYVLGGGLASRLTALLLMTGGRMAMTYATHELGERAGLWVASPNTKQQ